MLGAFAPVYAEIVKIDEDQRMVFGYASTEKRDQQGEIIRLDAIKRALPTTCCHLSNVHR